MNIIRTLFWTVIGTGCLASLLGLAGRGWWLLELASHFRAQYAVLLAAGTLVLLITRHYRSAVVVAACAALNLYLLLPLYIPASASAAQPKTLRIVSVNVKAENGQRSPLLEFIQAADPDIVTLYEVSDDWLDTTAELESLFPYSRVNAIRGHFGSALFSKHPVEQLELKRFGRISHYAVSARLNINGTPLHLVAAHLLAPTHSAYFNMRNDHLEEIASSARRLPEPVMLIGDLNTSSWSPYFADLKRASGLEDGRPGFGIQASWPVGLPLLRIPIDHCLVSPGIVIRDWTRGPDIGSDHFPIVVDFSLPDGNARVQRPNAHPTGSPG